MKTVVATFIVTMAALFSVTACSTDHNKDSAPSTSAPEWSKGIDIESFWMDYANSRGGLTWGATTEYPEYEKVKEGDTILIQLEQGSCLMEFFHRRWRRANDVRRWDESVNEYGGCPYVFN